MLSKKQLILLRDWSLLKKGNIIKSRLSSSIYEVTDVGEHFVQFKYQDNRTGYLFVMPLSTEDFDGFQFEKLN